MVKKIKPEGLTWQEFNDAWYNLDHAGKIELARKAGVTYDTAKHWISESPGEKQAELIEQALMEVEPSTRLDFVCFDLETTNLRADFSVILTAVVKPFGGEAVVLRADGYPAWVADRANDSAVVEDISKELRQHAIVVTHYGGGFDIPYLRAKIAKYGLPPLPPMFHIDTWRIARGNFLVSSRRLKALGGFFGLGHKSDVEGALWMKAALNGDNEAMDAIVAHNIQDCVLLEKLACLSFPYLKSIPRM